MSIVSTSIVSIGLTQFGGDNTDDFRNTENLRVLLETGNSMTENIPQPWERQRNAGGKPEPMLWYDRFDKFYRPLGPERSLLAAYNLWKQERARARKIEFKPSQAPSRSWFDNARRWRWQERAEVWDEEQRQKRLKKETAEIEEARQQRIGAFRTLLARGYDRLKGGIESEHVALRAVVEGAKGLRLEYGEPSEVIEERGGHTVKLYRFTDDFPDAEEKTDDED